MTVAKRVRDCRYAKGWGPDELASRASISRTALYQIECGKTETPRAGTLRRIAEALGVTIESLLGNEDPRGLEVATSPRAEPPTTSARPHEPENRLSHLNPPSSLMAREHDLQRMLHEILGSPVGDGIARIIEETYRMIPAMERQTSS